MQGTVGWSQEMSIEDSADKGGDLVKGDERVYENYD